MSKRRLDIDDDLLAEARELLGASTDSETLNSALREAVAVMHRRAFLERMIDEGLPDLRDPEVMDGAWRKPETAPTRPPTAG